MTSIRITKQHRAADEQILARIIACTEASGRTMMPHFSLRPGSRSSGNGFGGSGCGPACAVGMGLLFGSAEVRGRLLDDPDYDALDAFAEIHGVRRDFASGISDGFEGGHICGERMRTMTRDYARGYAVGVAAYYYTTLDGTDHE